MGLLTVAAMLPPHWEKKLIDMNVEDLKDDAIQRADYVFIGAMQVQQPSVEKIIEKCKQHGVKIVAGGPLFTTNRDDYDEIDHLVLNEAELTLPNFIKDLEDGKLKHIYTSQAWADITKTPLPLWELIDPRKYACMNIQYSRGCPYDCEFCDITVLYGRKPRTKTITQIIDELEYLYQRGWRGSVFVVDDNFIGNKRKLKEEVLPGIINWIRQRKYPFSFLTEASLNLADDKVLVDMMVQAGFEKVFIGIETVNEESLKECNKFQNRNRDLVEAVKRIQRGGLEVQGGFIIGFDNDSPSIFDEMVSFIQESGIATAMVGMLTALRGTKLYKRLENENRLLQESTGNNTAPHVNFVTKMNVDVLIKGYENVIQTIYSPKNYYHRVIQFLKVYRYAPKTRSRIRIVEIRALIKSMYVLGIAGKERFYYWKLFFWSLIYSPYNFSTAITLAIYGFHFRKVFAKM